MLEGDALAEFRAGDWRRHPRVFRGAIDPVNYRVDTTKLFQLCEDDRVESRLIRDDFTVDFGPFEYHQADNQRPLAEGQMLMVQCLEQQLESVSRLITEQFAFLPRWQIDDVMASLGHDGASCGPHFDQYDVFLLQLTGSKIWHLDREEHGDDELLPDSELRLLAEFGHSDELLVEPGDVLYIPPGAGHHGICQGESLTLSIGIRNPTTTELLAEIAEFALESTGMATLETDLHPAGAGFGKPVIDDLSHLFEGMVTPRVLQTWYGSYVTRLRNPDVIEPAVGMQPLAGRNVQAALATRLAWSDAGDTVLFFVNGECHELPAECRHWIESFCLERSLKPDDLNETRLQLIEDLISAGSLILE